MMNAIRSTIKNLRNWIADIVAATKEAFAEMEAEKKNASPTLSELLRDYMNLRKAERSEWSRYGQQKGTADDLKAVSKALIYLKEHELFTLEDLDTALQGVNEKAGAINADMKKASSRMKVITGIQNAVADCQTHKAVHDKYLKIGWKSRQAAYAEKHKDELDSFNKAFRYLKKQGVDLNVNLDALQTEYDGLKATHTELAGQLATVKEELQPMKDIRYWIGKVLTPEQAEVEKKPEPKHSLTEMYGIHVNRNGMAVCPFHNDKNPSMKVDMRFHCFACQADGDAVDFVSRLFGLPSKEAAMKLADDFGIGYDSKQKPSVRPKIREPTPEQRYQQEENRCYKVLTDYFHSLRAWKQQYAPKQPGDEWHPLFVEALQRESYIEYLLDILLYGTPEEKKALVAEQRKEVMKLEQRFAERRSAPRHSRSQRKSGLDR